MTAGEQMRIKSYFAKSVDQALADAGAELGSEAVLLNTRKVPATPTASGGYEVTFGISGDTPEAIPEAIFTPPVVRAATVAAKASIAAANVARQVMAGKKNTIKPQKRAPHQLASKLLDLHRELDEIRTSLPAGAHTRVSSPLTAARKSGENVDRQGGGPLASELTRLHSQLDEIQGLLERSSRAQVSVGRGVPEIADMYSRLLAADVDSALAKDLANRLEDRLTAKAGLNRTDASSAATERRIAHQSDPDRLEALLREELENRVTLASRLGADGAEIAQEGPVVVLVGPRGVGKTTSLAKLAVSSARFGNRYPARFLSLDFSRSTAHLQLQSVATMYRIAFQEVSADHSLVQLIAETRREEAVFVDTPGYTTGDARSLEVAAAIFAECSALDIHLVVPAYMKACDLRECIQTFAPFRPSKLLVTKLDEAKTLGSVYSEAARAGLKLSFMTDGPGIPHDIRTVSSEDLLAMGFDRRKARAQHVA